MKSIDIFSPVGDLGSGFGPGGSSQPAVPSIHPMISMTDASGDSPSGSKPAEEFAGIGPTMGCTVGVSLATGAPESYDAAGLGDMMVDGLGTPPKP